MISVQFYIIVKSITFHQRKCAIFVIFVSLLVCHTPHIPFVQSIMERDRKCDPPQGPY